jgi:ubiquinone/menaquinone biosynthesis C-methylase UbiE
MFSKPMIEAKVRQEYNRLAAAYDRRWSSYITNTLSFLKTWVAIEPEAVVLDIACGTGEFERLILAEHPRQHMVGVDISEKMLDIASHKLVAYPHVAFQVATASALPFTDQCFDVIVSASAFHYFDSPEAALVEMKRVLKPEGKVIILDWCKDYLFCRSLDWVLKIVDPAHQQCYTQAEFHHLLTSTGFEICQAAQVRLGLVWGLMIATVVPHSL